MEECPGVRKGAWTAEEDNLLRKCIVKYGEGKWHQVPSRAGLNRCRKSCRLRWLNYLKPNIKRGGFSADEVDLIIRLHKLLGNRWSLIAGRIPGRTANDVKNYWNTHLSKKDHSCKKVTHPKRKFSFKNSEKKIQVVKPLPRSFSKNSCHWFKDQPINAFSNHNDENNDGKNNNENNVIVKDNDDKFKLNLGESSDIYNNVIMKDDAPESNLGEKGGGTMWWENLLEESEDSEKRTEEAQCSWINSALSSFDADLWNLFNAEHESV